MVSSGMLMIAIGLMSTSDTGLLLGLAGGGLTLILTGLLFLGLSRYLRNFTGGDALDDAVPGTAQVRSVADTGVTINNVNAVFRVQATITVPGQPPYDGEFRMTLGRAQWGAIQPGMTVPVLVERDNLQKIVMDPSRSVVAGAGAGGTPPIGQTMTAADVIARGVASQGLLQAVDPTGLTAGQVATALPAHEADDPIMKVVFTYNPAGMGEQRSEILIRVPDGKGHWLQPGETLPIAYLPDEPGTATIDWSRL